MKFVLKRTSVFYNYLECQTEKEQKEILDKTVGELPIKDKVNIEELNYTINYTNGNKQVSKVKRVVIELSTLEELMDFVGTDGVVIEKYNYDYPVLEIYDDFRE